jgi:hypothetical protein
MTTLVKKNLDLTKFYFTPKKVESGSSLPDYSCRIRIHSGVFKAIESAALRLGLVLELQYSARSLFPPSQYSGLTLQLIRVMPGRQRGTSSQVHRVHILLEMLTGVVCLLERTLQLYW